MNTLLKLALIILSCGYFTSAAANLQPEMNESDNQIHKMYVPLDSLHFSVEGIFLKNALSLWMKVDHLGFDTRGYYITGIFDGLFRPQHYITQCRSCRAEYPNRAPQPCEVCGQSIGLDYVYIEDSYWDRS